MTTSAASQVLIPALGVRITPVCQRGTALTRNEAARLRWYQHTVAPRYGRCCQTYDAQLGATPRAGNGGRFQATPLREAILIARDLGSTVH